MPDPAEHPRRYAIVGTGARAEMFARAIAVDHADTARLVAMADPNPVRLAAHNTRLAALGAAQVPTWPAERFTEMLAAEGVDVAVVTTVDRHHAGYVVAALDAGCDVITEKPMTVTAEQCREVLAATTRTGRRVTVSFNYRYNPVHEAVREVLASGEIGEVGSVHFEWLLDTRHGADYFRRWHRRLANAGGLLVHKASHHFDLVNWWLGTLPTEVYAAGRLFFYGQEAGRRHGYARDYQRAHGAPAAADDPFALHLADHPGLRALYLDAEHVDGYHRDQNVFGTGIDIADDLAVLVRYASGASMSYHLTAYSPWEGYRVMFNGSRGRLELEVVENDHVTRPAPRGTGTADSAAGGAWHGVAAAAEQGWARLTVHPFWQRQREILIDGYTREGHGGADARMLADLLRRDPGAGRDALGRSATAWDGAAALLVGLAGNASLACGRAVRVADLIDLSPAPRPATAAPTTTSDGKEPTS